MRPLEAIMPKLIAAAKNEAAWCLSALVLVPCVRYTRW
jgi:hypothetical protein